MYISAFYGNMKKLCLAIVAMQGIYISAYAQTWTQKTDFINGESSSAYAFTINDTIYVGNTGGVNFYEYDYSTDVWTPKANVPVQLFNRTGATGFAVSGKGYMIGGIDAAGVCSSQVWEYDPATDSWMQKSGFPGGKRAHGLVFVIGNKAYFGGGIDTIDAGGFSMMPKNDFWEYDPATDNWLQRHDLPYDSCYLDWPFAFSDSSKGYIVCGARYKLANGSYNGSDVRNTWQYDPATDSWIAKTNYPGAARSGGVSFVINHKAYCGTGLNDVTVASYNDFYSYDISNDTWSMLAANPLGQRAYAIAATVSAGKAYLGTGWQAPGLSYDKDWWEFTPAPEGIGTLPTTTGITCYPNPCTAALHVQLDNNNMAGYTYSLYDLQGQMLMNDKLPANCIINTGLLPGGNYVLLIKGHGLSFRKLITVLPR